MSRPGILKKKQKPLFAKSVLVFAESDPPTLKNQNPHGLKFERLNDAETCFRWQSGATLKTPC